VSTKLEEVLNYRVLLLINIAIIAVAELGGHSFEETGIIHLIAIVFVALGISRIFVHYDAYDRYLRLLIRGGSLALFVFSASHLLEFLGYVYFKVYEDAIFVSVVNFYIASMLAVTVGAEYFLHTLKKNSTAMIRILITSMIVFLSLALLIFFQKILVSLGLDTPTPYIYAILVLGVSFLSVNRLLEIKKHVSIMTGFVNYFIAAFILITVSALQYVFYEATGRMGIPDFQIIYTSHFLFYGALTLMFLAFVRLTNLGGVYKEAEEYEKNNH